MKKEEEKQPKKVLFVQKYESIPIDESNEDDSNTQLISSDGNLLTTNKQEEWITKKKTELVTTKQIETRVKRQVILEDGKVVEDSGPFVSTTTTEDTDKNESEQTEHKENGKDPDPKDGWILVDSPPEDAVLKEMNERKVTTHDEVEDIIETEQIKHLGDVTSEKLIKAIREGSGLDTRKAFLNNDKNDLIELQPFERDVPSQKRIVQQSRRHDRTTDIEDTKETSKLNEKGNLITEILKRHEHEDFHNEDIPDSDSDEFDHIEEKEGIRDYNIGKTDDYVEYFSVPRSHPFQRPTKIGERRVFTCENVDMERQGEEDLWESVSERIFNCNSPNNINKEISNTEKNESIVKNDILLTRKYPIDLIHVEQQRKHETNEWLDHHFGSSSSNTSISSSNSKIYPKNGFHVTVRSKSPQNICSTNETSSKFQRDQTLTNNRKKITFQEPTKYKSIEQSKFDMRSRHDDISRSMNSEFGHGSVVTKSGEDLWTPPTPPPRYRKRNSPDLRSSYMSSPDNKYSIQRDEDAGERKSYERREESFKYSGSNSEFNGLEGKELGDDGWIRKESNYYKANENSNPTQNKLYDTGRADIIGKKTVERREQNFSYDGPSQKQFHPKYILGTSSSTLHRLRNLDDSYTNPPNNRIKDVEYSQTLQSPRKQYYFGDENDEKIGYYKNAGYGMPKELRKLEKGGSDDINVSISNNYNLNTSNQSRKNQSLNRSYSFTPNSISTNYKNQNFIREEKYRDSHDDRKTRFGHYKSNPYLVESSTLLSPKLISYMSRNGRDIEDDELITRKNELVRTESPYSRRSDNISPINWISKNRSTKGSGSSGFFGDKAEEDEHEETYRMTSSTQPYNEANQDESEPKITTDTTSKFSRRTLRDSYGQPSGKIESSQTTTRTKSHFKESGGSASSFDNGRHISSPIGASELDSPTFISNPRKQYGYDQRKIGRNLSNNGSSVVIPIRDPNNNRHVHYAN